MPPAEQSPASEDRSITVHVGVPAQLPAATVYAVLRLRVDVFVVEQECPYPELDGRDLEAGAHWWWAERGGEVVATLRVLVDDPGTARIGRVATAGSARSGGVAARLMRHALETAGARDVVLDAQAYLEGWYARFGFVRDGEPFVEDGIPHVPMRLRGGTS